LYGKAAAAAAAAVAAAAVTMCRLALDLSTDKTLKEARFDHSPCSHQPYNTNQITMLYGRTLLLLLL
jgi:hypothetical protein